MRELFDAIKFILDFEEAFGVHRLAEYFKEISFACRKAWMADMELGIHSPIHRVLSWDLTVFGYLGRALPCKTPNLVTEDRKKAESRFFEHPPFTRAIHLIECLKNKISKWIQRAPRHLMVETPPYSESASLITPRNIGGQARFFRDLIDIAEIATRSPEGRRRILCHMLPVGVDSDGDHGISFNFYGMGSEPSQRWQISQTISEICYWLDRPFLDHITMCRGDCEQSELHFPFEIKGIPETGWRSRCASMPWPTLCYMTEIPRRTIIRGAKNDPISGDALGSFEKLPTACEFDFINSTDLDSATDYLPLDVQFQVGQRIGKHWAGTSFEPYIYGSFSRQRIVNTKFENWPGLRYFANRVIRRRRETVLDLVRKRYQSEKTRQVKLGLFAKFGIKPNMPSHYDDKEDNPMPIENDGKVIEKILSDLSNRFVHEGMGKSQKKSFTSEGYRLIPMREYVADEDFDKSYCDPDVAMLILGEIRDWYRNNFKSQKGRLSNQGQHMSLPLSWVVLSAINSICVDDAKKVDPKLVAFTMGDDCVVGTSNQLAIDRYHSNLKRMGLRINYKKDMTSREGRLVFCEHLIDRKHPGKWVDSVRSKIVTQPDLDEKGIQWLSVREQPPKWYTPVQKSLIQDLKVVKHYDKILIASQHGFEPRLPTEFGGFGYEKWTTKYWPSYVSRLQGVNVKDLSGIVAFDKECQKVAGINTPYSYSGMLWNTLEDTEYYLSNRKWEKYTTAEVNNLLVSQVLPSLIYHKNFIREEYSRKSPAEVGERLWKLYSQFHGGPPQMSTMSDLTEIRSKIRVRSWHLDFLDEKKLDTLEFWKFH